MMSLLSPQLEAFMAIVKHTTVHAAANSMYLTQTAVTQRIRSLERALKTTLFIRTRKGMILTKEGEALLRYCLTSKELEGAALAKIQGAGVESEIELAFAAPTSIMHTRIIPACIPIMRQYPNLLFSFNVNDSTSQQSALRSAQVDFAIVQEHDLAEEMAYKVLRPEQYILVCSAKWKDRKLTDIIKQERIIDFDQADQITLNYLKHYELLDSVKHSRYFVNRTDNLALLVSEGIGYTTLAKEFAKPYIDNNQLITLNRSLAYDITPILAWYDRHEPPNYFTSVIKAIK